MKAIMFFLIAFNVGVEAMRVYDPAYYTVKEVKIKKIESIKQYNISGNDRRLAS